MLETVSYEFMYKCTIKPYMDEVSINWREFKIASLQSFQRIYNDEISETSKNSNVCKFKKYNIFEIFIEKKRIRLNRQLIDKQ